MNCYETFIKQAENDEKSRSRQDEIYLKYILKDPTVFVSDFKLKLKKKKKELIE